MLDYDFFTDFNRLRREMDEMFNNYNRFLPRDRFGTGFRPEFSGGTFPRVNIRDDGEGYLIEAVAPGLDADQIEVNAHRNSLSIGGEVPVEKDVKPENFHRSERRYGKFRRNFTLPTPIDVTRVEADYKRGVLTVRAPKAEEAKPKAISVAVSN